MVSLSRHELAAVPSAKPNSTAGFSADSRLAASTALAASLSSFVVSKPATAATTTPNFDSAENRPPICGSP